jgi:hypothetical protein
VRASSWKPAQPNSGCGVGVCYVLRRCWPSACRWRDLVEDWASDFEQGVESYLAGEWRRARDIFTDCLSEKPWDGPTLKIMETMSRLGAASGGQAPADWPGFTAWS